MSKCFKLPIASSNQSNPLWLTLSLDRTTYDKLADGSSLESYDDLFFEAIGISRVPLPKAAYALKLFKQALETRAKELKNGKITKLRLIVNPGFGENYDKDSQESQD